MKKWNKYMEKEENQKDMILLVLQSIPIFGILILVLLGALNYEYNYSGSTTQNYRKSGTYLERVKMGTRKGKVVTKCGSDGGVKVKLEYKSANK